jgi:hypothetical protein
VKRYQNRMRYLAARLRPPVHEPDRIDSLLHWLGPRLLRRALVPPAWFEERPGQAVAEPALILLGAIELFAPKAFAGSPAELLTGLDALPPGERDKAWAAVRGGFASIGLAMPTPVEIARYAAFVQATVAPGGGPMAEIIPFARDPAPGPRSA